MRGTLNGYFGINSYGFVNGNAFDLKTAGGTTNFSQDYNATINASDPETFLPSSFLCLFRPIVRILPARICK